MVLLAGLTNIEGSMYNLVTKLNILSAERVSSFLPMTSSQAMSRRLSQNILRDVHKSGGRYFNV
jgi:hypothetical protein